MPSPDIGGARLSRQLDLICSGLAILAAASTWLGAWLNGPAIDVVALTKASGVVLLAASLLGLGLIKIAAGWERLGTAIIIEAVGRQLRMLPMARAVRLAPEETPARGIGGLVEALVWRVQRLSAAPPARAAPGDAYDVALREGRAQAQQIVKALYQDADTLSLASEEIDTVAERLDADGRAAGEAGVATESAFSRTERHLISLTRAVSATTAELRRVTQSAVTLSELAFTGQRRVGDLDDGTARLIIGIETIEFQVKRAGHLAQSAASEVANGGDPGAALALITAGIQEMAQATLASTAKLQADTAAMSGQVADAMRTAQEICEWVTAQHDIGLALSDAVGKQGQEISAIMRTLEEARSGFVTLRASVDAVTRFGVAHLATTGAVREAAGRLPSHADAVAAIMRDMPEFSPSSRFDL
jgi:hypothetical protein